MKKAIVLLTIVLLIFSGCGTTKVKRVDADKQIDLSGYWNDTDVKIVCETLINDCLNSPRVDSAIKASNKTPMVVVGRFRNESSEHINTDIISSIMETAIFNSGKMDFVAGGALREELRTERAEQQQGHTNPDTAAATGMETGADYLLTGTVRTIIDRDGNTTLRTYFVTAELTNIETNQRMWIGQNNEIKKIVTRPKNKI